MSRKNLPIQLNTDERLFFDPKSHTDRDVPNQMDSQKLTSRLAQPLTDSETQGKFQTGKFRMTNEHHKSDILNQNSKSLYGPNKSSINKQGSRFTVGNDFRFPTNYLPAN